MHGRKHLVSAEVEKLIAATKGTRHETRDRCLLLLMFRHGVRVSKACGLVLSRSIAPRVLPVSRTGSCATTAPKRRAPGDQGLADRPCQDRSRRRIVSRRTASPLSRKTAWLMIRDYGRLAGLPVEAHPHMLRHACGFALADQGADTRLIQDYLGHRNIDTIRTHNQWGSR